ncbi:MAG: YbgC/FadM family acyl-CoA thioesterase [Ignavibacteriales bacterium]
MTHRHTIRVNWEDTDAGGIVYHSNYLNFAERARTEMVRAAGISQVDLLAAGHAFAVRRAEVDFLKPARLDDLLEVESAVTEVGGASLEVRQTVRRLDDGAELVRLNIRLGFISLEGRPARMPEAIRASFETAISERV